MIIKYYWENMEVNVPTSGYNVRTISPHTHIENRDVEYEYEVVVKPRDIAQYLMPQHLTSKRNKTLDDINEIRLAAFYMEKVIYFFKEHLNCDYEELINDPDFYEFMKGRYEDSALASWEEENESY